MSDASLTIAFTVDRTPEEAFAAITNVRGWWSGEIDGDTDVLGAEFTYRYQDIHRSTQKITELVPGRKVTWHVVDGYLSFTEDTTEWTGTDITFDITPKDGGTEVRFPHRPRPRLRVLRQLFRRVELLRRQQPAQPNHQRRRAAEPARGRCSMSDRPAASRCRGVAQAVQPPGRPAVLWTPPGRVRRVPRRARPAHRHPSTARSPRPTWCRCTGSPSP
jgi:hypothetical protein